VLFVYLLSKRLFNSEEISLVAAFFLAVMGLHLMRTSGNIRPDSFGITLILAAFYFLKIKQYFPFYIISIFIALLNNSTFMYFSIIMLSILTASFILKNMIFWNDELLARASPVLEEKEGLSRKVKPLCLITEEETLIFCKLSNITYVEEQCPYKSEVYEIFKSLVYEINKEFPGSIAGFYKGYLKRLKTFYSQPLKEILVHRCIRCGYPTTTQLCSVCRLKEKLLQYKHG
jgi:uncharacterized protein (TIGR00269 family)